MDAPRATKRRRPWAIFLALIPAISFAQQNPGLTVRPSGQALDGPPAKEKLIDLSRPERQQTTLVPATAESDYFEAAMRGEAWAQTKLGKIYVSATDDPERQQKGIELLQRAAAQKDAEALFALATVSATGPASKSSVVELIDKLKKAAELGSADAQYEMAVMLMNDPNSSELNKREALELTRKAAYQGHAKAQHSAAITLLRQASNAEDAREGISLLEKAAAQNHREAIMVLAGILTRGEFGLAKDQRRAEKLLLARAKEGDLEFQFGLATLYLYGDQLGEVRDAGMAWLRKSADAGYEKSKNLLAKIASEASAQ